MAEDKKKDQKPEQQSTLLGMLTGKMKPRDRLSMGQDNPRNAAALKAAGMEPKKKQVEAKKKDSRRK